MKPERAEALLAVLALVATVAAVMMTAGSVRSVPDRRRHLDQLLETRSELVRMSAGLVDDQAALLRYQRLPEARPTDLAALADRVAPGLPVEVRRRERKEIGQDWILNRMEVVFGQIALPDLGRFIDSAERQRPPWRLVECRIEAHPSLEGEAAARLLMEGVQK
jgi:hypothetical protein